MTALISFYSPNIVWTLAPTVRASLVNTVSTLRIAERSRLTHKEYANKPIYIQSAYQLFQATSTQTFQGLYGK
jgi:hypothetical protein